MSSLPRRRSLGSLGASAVLGAALATAGCAAAPRPRILGEAELTRQAPAVRESERLAPQAFLAAEEFRKRAENAYLNKDLAGSQILAEHALAAYSHAVVLTRLLKADRRAVEAEARLKELQKQLEALDRQEVQIAAEADDLELRAKVLRDAVPLPENGPVAADRAQARKESAKNLALQARLLCSATRLLGASADQVSQELKALDELDQTLDGKPPAAAPASSNSEASAPPALLSSAQPIDRALRLRAACLTRLTEIRRPATTAAPAAGAVDALQTELTSGGAWFTFRDDRGVGIILRGLFAQDSLTPAAQTDLGALAKIAQSHPAFPLLVVLHSASGPATAGDKVRAQSLADALTKAGAPKVEALAAGSANPVVDPKRPGSAERNQRVEVVFVAPSY